MDTLQEIILSLTKEEQREFKRFIQRNKQKSSRLDLGLFNILVERPHVDKLELPTLLYGDSPNLNAYHSVRKRLIKQLNDFIYLKRIEHDESLEGEIAKNLAMVRHLFNHQLDRRAWKYLRKSERLAEKLELNQQLKMIYQLQIEHFNPVFLEESLHEIVQKRKNVAALAQEDENLKIIESFVQQELKKVKIHAVELDLEYILNLLLNTFDMEDSLFRRPKLRYNFLSIARGIILANKQFHAFEDYVIHNYEKIEASGYFNNRSSHRLNVLYMISHTLFRNKKFSKAITYLEQMKSVLESVNKGVFNQYNVKYRLLLAACENFLGNIQKSIDILEELEKQPISTEEDYYNARLNLSIYYFQQKNYKAANKCIVQMGRTDNWFEKRLGVEWRIKKNLIEIIYQYELAHFELVLDRVTALERTQKNVLSTQKYNRVFVFLQLIKQMVRKPDILHTEPFFNQVESSFEWVEKSEEDLQAMGYYAWLKSKMQKRDFVAVLHELLS